MAPSRLRDLALIVRGNLSA